MLGPRKVFFNPVNSKWLNIERGNTLKFPGRGILSLELLRYLGCRLR
jgi:hypothetical protein